MKKILFSIAIIFICLLINRLSAQSSNLKLELGQSDSFRTTRNGLANQQWEDSLRQLGEIKIFCGDHTKGDTFYEATCPKFVGGRNAMNLFIVSNIHYPYQAREEGAEGYVYIGFIVDIDGSLQNIHVTRFSKTGYEVKEEFYNLLKEEAMRVVRSMPNWSCGTQRSKPVRVAQNLTFPFRVE